MSTELFLWDWNGTLLDDVALCVDALNRLLARHGYSQRYDLESYRKIFGFPVEEYYLRAGFDFSRNSFDELAKSYMADYIPASTACPLTGDARPTLDRLHRAGLRQVILSASPIDTLRRQTAERGVADCFDTLLGLGDIYAKSKVELERGKVKLYCNQVFIADNIKEVIPEYLLLLNGVIDCPDIPLNVSRSFLQNDRQVQKISKHIVKKVSDKLTGLYKTDREKYEKCWADLSPWRVT